MKFVTLVLVTPLLLAGCSNDDDDEDFGMIVSSDTVDTSETADNDGVVTPVPDIPSEEYIDSFITLRYPSSWLVNPNGSVAGLDVQFTDSQINATDGVDNCGFIYSFDPFFSLMDAVDGVLPVFDTVPEPRIEFLEVNGVPAMTVTGSVTILNIQIPAIAQSIAGDGLQVSTICIGSSDEEFELILSTVTIN